jgi:hypothetical protein
MWSISIASGGNSLNFSYTRKKPVRCYGSVSIKYISIENPIRKPNNSHAQPKTLGLFPSPSLPTPWKLS